MTLITAGWGGGAYAAADRPALEDYVRDGLTVDRAASSSALVPETGPQHRQADNVEAGAPCDPVTQDSFRWVSVAIMSNGLPILAYSSSRTRVLGAGVDQDGESHPRVARYLSETAISEPIVLDDDPELVGWDNPTSVDIATNGEGGLILVTFADPRLRRVMVRRSTDLGVTWSPADVLPSLSSTDVNPLEVAGHFHQLYYDRIGGLFYYSYGLSNRSPLNYVTSADGITWSAVHSWGGFGTSNGSNRLQSRIARFFRTNAGTWIAYGNLFSSNANMGVARFGNGVCDTLDCWPSQQIELFSWRSSDTTPAMQDQRSMLHTPGAAFYLPGSPTPDRIHLLFGATGLTGFRSVPTGHLFHWWSDDDGRTWWNENGLANGHESDIPLTGAADAETPIPEPPTGPLADIDGVWVPAFGKMMVWGVEGNNANAAPGLAFSVFGDGVRDQTRVQGLNGYPTCFEKKERSFLWVHGIQGSFRDEDSFSSLLDPLLERYGARLSAFPYFQDAGYQTLDGRCVDMPPHSVPDETGGLPLTLTPSSVDPNTCDSQSDVGLNAVLLDDEIRRRHAQFGGPVTLIANSMGGAIVRAFLAYSVAASTGTDGLVDNIYFLQGVQQGSHLAYPASTLSGLRDSRHGLDRILGDLISRASLSLAGGWDPTRPAAADLRPRSDTLSFVNPSPAHVPDHIGYFNVASDIQWIVELRVTSGIFHRRIGLTTPSFGDYVILPGTDTPTDLALFGGARFDPGTVGRGRDAHQWLLRRDHIVAVNLLVPFLGSAPVGDLSVLGDPFGVPESHLQLGKKMHQITYLTDRVTGEVLPLNELIYQEIVRQDE